MLGQQDNNNNSCKNPSRDSRSNISHHTALPQRTNKRAHQADKDQVRVTTATTSPSTKKPCFINVPPASLEITVSTSLANSSQHTQQSAKSSKHPPTPVVNLSATEIPAYKILAETITGVQTSVNDGLNQLKMMLTQPISGISPHLSTVEKYIPVVKELQQCVQDPMRDSPHALKKWSSQLST